MTLSPAIKRAVEENRNKFAMIDPLRLPQLDSDLAAGLAEIGLRRATKRELQSLIVKTVKEQVDATERFREWMHPDE